MAPFCGAIKAPFTKVEGLFTVLMCRLQTAATAAAPTR
jgi:hypothetical protein